MNYIKNKLEVVKNSKVLLATVCLIIGWTYCYLYIAGVPYYNWLITGRNFSINAIDRVEAYQGGTVQTVPYQAEGQRIETGSENSPEALIGIFTAYNAEKNQTDSDPTTMASGKKVYNGAIANNCLPFGTKIKLDGKTYTVDDKMNSRYDCDHFDIYFESYDEAIKFGKKELNYEKV